MFLNTIYIVAKEALEVAYIACLVLALLRFTGVKVKAITIGVVLGVFGAILYANSFVFLSGLFSHTGVEVITSTIFVLMVLCILYALYVFSPDAARPYFLPWVLSAVLALSIVKELSEIILYLMPAIQKFDKMLVLSGLFVGLGVGVSGVVVLYFILMRFRKRTMGVVACVLLAFLAGGLLMQSVALLAQAGYLNNQLPLWNTEWLISEESILGQMLFSLFSYEASPTLNQLVGYWTVVVVALIFTLRQQVWSKSAH